MTRVLGPIRRGSHMSWKMEFEEGTSLVCTAEFVSYPEGSKITGRMARRFRIGERVSYLAAFRNPNLMGTPLEWLFRFRADDALVYAASTMYFTNVAQWDDLVAFFSQSDSSESLEALNQV